MATTPTHLVNVFRESQIHIWLRLVLDGPDLDVEEVQVDKTLGAEPSWMGEIRESGWDSILDTVWCAEGGRWLKWALAEGIVPGQRFWVCVREPTWVGGSYEYPDEYDIEWDAEVVYREPWSDKRAANAWERAIKSIQKSRQAITDFHRAERAIQRSDVSAMFLHSDVYFAPGQYPSDDMEMPAGVRCSLQTSATTRPRKDCHLPWATATLASGEDHDGNWQRAIENMATNARKELPELAHVDFQKLPRRG